MEFVETFLRNSSEGQWINRERERLTNGIIVAANEPQRITERILR